MKWLFGLLLAALVVGLAFVGIHAAGQHHSTPSPSATASQTGASQDQGSEREAATNLAALLTESSADRDAISAAVSDGEACGPNLDQDVQAFRNAAASRQHLLSELETLPDGSALPPAMLQALTSAWKASLQADNDFAAWAQDENSNPQGCSSPDDDSNYQAASVPDQEATTDKQQFVDRWNPIASTYELKTYEAGQL